MSETLVIIQHKMNRGDGRFPVSLANKLEFLSKAMLDCFTLITLDSPEEQDKYVNELAKFTGYEVHVQDVFGTVEYHKKQIYMSVE